MKNCNLYKKKKKAETIAEYINSYYRNRNKFESQQYRMNIDQIKLNNIMLDFEKKVFFNLFNNETNKQTEERIEKRFMQMFTCCDRGFETFAEFARHKEIVHKEGQDETKEENCEIISPEYKYIPIKLITTDDVTSSGDVEKTRQYKCTVEGCYKTYTSAYGLRYHTEKGHMHEVKDSKPHKCTFENCAKRYKNVNGLKYHLTHAHQ